jgi:hypothetical protein
VTIGTTNLALFDFSLYPVPTPAAVRVGGYVRDFVPNVIELEDDDVRLATVDAWVRREIINEPSLCNGLALGDVAVDPCLLPLMVLPIVPGVRLGEALPTPRLQLRLASPHRRKLIERLHFAAFRARSHERERAVGSTPRE